MLKNQPPEKEHKLTVEDRKKGGLIKSPAKKMSAKLRELKKKGLSDSSAKRLYELMTDPELSSLDILIFIESAKGLARTALERNAIAKTLLEWHKSIHGDKRTNQINITSENALNNIIINIIDPTKE